MKWQATEVTRQRRLVTDKGVQNEMTQSTRVTRKTRLVTELESQEI